MVSWLSYIETGPRFWTIKANLDKSSSSIILTHYGLMMPYGDPELGQHWLR